MYSQYRVTYDIASISETTTPFDKKFQQNIWTTKMCRAMQYCDVIKNPTWRTAAILKIAKSPYLSEKSSDFDKIWYTHADIVRESISDCLTYLLNFEQTLCT